MIDNNSKNQYEYRLQNNIIVDDHGNNKKKSTTKKRGKQIHKKVLFLLEENVQICLFDYDYY